MRTRLVVTLCAFACTYALVLASSAGAAVLAPEYSYGLGSAQLDGGAVYWLQQPSGLNYDYGTFPLAGSPGANGDSRDTTRILRRELGAAAPETAFEADPDENVTAFNAANGHLAVGTFNRHDGSSRIYEIKRDATGVATSIVTQRDGKFNGLTCFSRVRLIAINAQSETIVEELRKMSHDGNCASGTLRRIESTISAIAPDGSTRVLLERKAGWSTGEDDSTLGRLTWGLGDWFAQTVPDDEGGTPGPAGMFNLATGQFAEAQMPTAFSRSLEISGSGRVLINRSGEKTLLRPDPARPDFTRVLKRSRNTRWMHFCGDKILEISRRGWPWAWPRSMRRAGFWNVSILNADGIRERQLTQRLRRGTNFGTCNADTAIFHFYLRNGKARQFTVPLAPPAA
ncbi:MAG: hypothetical protein HY827_04570 [Actinobacteria bacterium]|nr:hypothetical protein [Actinomycetota bacterium]